MKTQKHLPTKPVLIGGLMRCCLETLAGSMVNEVKGEMIQCKHAPNNPLHQIIFDGKHWKWKQPPFKK